MDLLNNPNVKLIAIVYYTNGYSIDVYNVLNDNKSLYINSDNVHKYQGSHVLGDEISILEGLVKAGAPTNLGKYSIEKIVFNS